MPREKRPVLPDKSPEQVALSILRAWGPFTVGLFTQQLVNRWSMTPKTVESLIRRLVKKGLVVEDGKKIRVANLVKN